MVNNFMKNPKSVTKNLFKKIRKILEGDNNE